MELADDIDVKIDGEADAWKTTPATVFVGTWNLHARDPPADLTDFIPPSVYDLYAIGTEECEQSMEVALVYDDKSRWEKQLVRHIGPGWLVVQRVTLNAIHLIVFARHRFMPYISSISTSSVATGIGNIVGNKGGVGVSFCLGATSIAFVNCHFHAHDSDFHQRNADFHVIDANLNLGSASKRRQTVSEFFDVVFWFGDLNYRINGGRRMVDDLLRRGMFEVMKANEQLGIEIRKGAVFSGFQEAEIRFPPTYKFDKDCDVYDSSSKQRVPSWTDRVLWKCSDRVRNRSYASIDSMRTSDHRPVVSTFDIVCEASPIRPADKTDLCLIQ